MPELNGKQSEWDKFGMTMWNIRDFMRRNQLLGRRQPASRRKVISRFQQSQQRKVKKHGGK